MIEKINEYTSTVVMSTNPPVRQVVSDSDSFEVTLSNASSGNNEELMCSEELEAIFAEASETYDISLSLLKAVAKAESDFDPNCTSSAGAMGIMQLMPGTAEELGVTDAYDPRQNIMAGAKYLSENLDIFDGDVSLAVAAYNAGRGAVAKYDGIPPYTETQNYVKKVLAYMNEDISVPDVSVSQGASSGYSYTYTATAPTTTVHEITENEQRAIEKLTSQSSTYILTQIY